DGLVLKSRDFEVVVKIQADTRMEAVRGASIVLLCVKTLDTELAARLLAPHLEKDALLVSFQNGVDNAERIQRATGIPAIPSVVYVAAAMTGPGQIQHNGRGDIVIGELPRLSAVFERAVVPCRVTDNIDGELWTKLVMNCAYNAISALTHRQY